MVKLGDVMGRKPINLPWGYAGNIMGTYRDINLNNMISGGVAYRGFRQQTLGWENKTNMGYLYNGTLYVTNNVMWMFMPAARKPARRFCVFLLFFHVFAL